LQRDQIKLRYPQIIENTADLSADANGFRMGTAGELTKHFQNLPEACPSGALISLRTGSARHDPLIQFLIDGLDGTVDLGVRHL
jgi:hypothetical protein